jgi:hypothetical protein
VSTSPEDSAEPSRALSYSRWRHRPTATLQPGQTGSLPGGGKLQCESKLGVGEAQAVVRCANRNGGAEQRPMTASRHLPASACGFHSGDFGIDKINIDNVSRVWGPHRITFPGPGSGELGFFSAPAYPRRGQSSGALRGASHICWMAFQHRNTTPA